MDPHEDSVVPLEIQSLSQALYDKLITMEAHNYENMVIGSTLEQNQALWTKYCNAWLGYKTKIGLTRNQCMGFVTSFYSFALVHMGFGAGPSSLFDDSKADVVFNSNGAIDTVLGYPNDYYNDVVVPVTPAPIPGEEPQEPQEPYSTNMDNDIPMIAGAGEADVGKFDDLVQNRYPEVVQQHQLFGVLFSDDIQPPQVAMSKSAMWDLIFIDMGWQAFFVSQGHGDVVPPKP